MIVILVSFAAQPRSREWGFRCSRSYCLCTPDSTAGGLLVGMLFSRRSQMQKEGDQKVLRGSLLETQHLQTSFPLSPGSHCVVKLQYPKSSQPSSPHFLLLFPLGHLYFSLSISRTQPEKELGLSPVLTKSSSGLSRVRGACYPGQFLEHLLWHFPKFPCCLLETAGSPSSLEN